MEDGDLKEEVERKRAEREKLAYEAERMRMTTMIKQYKVMTPPEDIEKKEGVTDEVVIPSEEEKKDVKDENTDKPKDKE